MEPVIECRTQLVHGYRRFYRIGGSGPPVLLIHGIGDSSETWSEVLPLLAENHTVIAPDLLGHGQSDKPRADYSVPAFANGMRDLLTILEIDRVTVIGHSFGGGVAAQLIYQFPELVERLILVAAGGAGKRVSGLLRMMSLPPANLALSALRLPFTHRAIDAGIRLSRAFDWGLGLDGPDVRRVITGLPDNTSRSAFVRTLRSVVDWRGQVVTMLDRSYLSQDVPTLIIWGSRDSILPARHSDTVHAALPTSRLEVFDGAGHFPFRTDPHRFVKLLEEFMAGTEPASFDRDRWRARLCAGQPESVQQALSATPPLTMP